MSPQDDIIETLAGLSEEQRLEIAANLRQRAARLAAAAARIDPGVIQPVRVARGPRIEFRGEPFYARVRRSWALRCPSVFAASGLSLEEFARRLGVKESTAISFLRQPTSARCAQIAQILGVTVESLFEPVEPRT